MWKLGSLTEPLARVPRNLSGESFEFSNGEHKLPGVKYAIGGLGNQAKPHREEHQWALGGEGDDDKSMEEDYLEWKDTMWAALSADLGVEEGSGGDVPDFAVTELETHVPEKVYLGKSSSPTTVLDLTMNCRVSVSRRTFCSCPHENQRHP